MAFRQHGVQVEISTGQVVLLAAGVFAVVNFGSALVIWRDKRRAIGGQGRIPEETLLVWALGGGWPGGVWAMRRFRHKTSRPSFIGKYVLAATLNLAAAAAVTYAVLS